MASALDHRELPEPRASAFATMRSTRARPPRSLWSRLVARPEPAPTSSPWGAIADANEIAPGILWFSTAARSGYRLSAKRQRALPQSLRTEDGWYEDSSEWAAVAVVFDRIFDLMPAGDAGDCSLYQTAKETLRNWRPEEYESWFQTTMDEAEIDALAVTQLKCPAGLRERHDLELGISGEKAGPLAVSILGDAREEARLGPTCLLAQVAVGGEHEAGHRRSRGAFHTRAFEVIFVSYQLC